MAKSIIMQPLVQHVLSPSPQPSNGCGKTLLWCRSSACQLETLRVQERYLGAAPHNTYGVVGVQILGVTVA